MKLSLLVIALGFALSTHAAHADDAALPLPGIDNFDKIVGTDIYRGAAPSKEALGNLFRDYQVQSIIDLEAFREDAIEDERDEVLKQGKKFFEEPMTALPWFLSVFSRVDKKEMDEIQSILSDPKNRPIYVHCLQGMDRTGLVIGLYQVKAGLMTPEQACNDMLDHGFHPKYHSLVNYFRDQTGYTCTSHSNQNAK